jgi:hypothetical protein
MTVTVQIPFYVNPRAANRWRRLYAKSVRDQVAAAPGFMSERLLLRGQGHGMLTATLETQQQCEDMIAAVDVFNIDAVQKAVPSLIADGVATFIDNDSASVGSVDRCARCDARLRKAGDSSRRACVEAEGRLFHTECFTCDHCRSSLMPGYAFHGADGRRPSFRLCKACNTTTAGGGSQKVATNVGCGPSHSHDIVDGRATGSGDSSHDAASPVRMSTPRGAQVSPGFVTNTGEYFDESIDLDVDSDNGSDDSGGGDGRRFAATAAAAAAAAAAIRGAGYDGQETPVNAAALKR